MKTCRRRDQVQWRLSRARGRTSLVSISFDLTKMTVADSSVDKINVGVETNPRERLSGDVDDDDKTTSPTKTASTIDQQNTFCRKFALSRRQHRQRRRLSNVVRSSICDVVSTILAVVASAQSNEDSSLLPKNGKKLQYSLHTYAMFEFQSLAEIVTLI